MLSSPRYNSHKSNLVSILYPGSHRLCVSGQSVCRGWKGTCCIEASHILRRNCSNSTQPARVRQEICWREAERTVYGLSGVCFSVIRTTILRLRQKRSALSGWSLSAPQSLSAESAARLPYVVRRGREPYWSRASVIATYEGAIAMELPCTSK